MISGFIVGILFLINIPYLYRRKPFSFKLLLSLALFDFIGEFAAQGTLLIDITVSLRCCISYSDNSARIQKTTPRCVIPGVVDSVF